MTIFTVNSIKPLVMLYEKLIGKGMLVQSFKAIFSFYRFLSFFGKFCLGFCLRFVYYLFFRGIN